MSMEFDQYAVKGKEFLETLAAELGHEDSIHAARVLRSVLHVLRDHLSVEVSLHMIAQLPMALKGIYVDGWSTHKGHENLKTVDDLCTQMMAATGPGAWRDYSSKDEIITAIKAVIVTLAKYISHGELRKVFATIASPLKETLLQWMLTESPEISETPAKK